MPQKDSRTRLGQLAVRRGYIKPALLKEAVARYNQSLRSGSQIPFGEFLIKEGYLTLHQFEDVLMLQKREETREFIPGYEFIRKLGQGAMGEVFLARQKSMDRLVAIKLLPEILSKDKDYIKRFFREARIAGKMNHVNIVRGLEVSSHENRYYFVMDYIKGKSLNELIPRGQGLDEEIALHYAMQVARALGYANEMGVIHRDIKPENILVDEKDIAHVCDMGLAKQLNCEMDLTMSGVTVGTPYYVSPEQARGDREIDTRSDIYSLGATLYYMLTGQNPFQGSSATIVMTKHLNEKIPNPRELNARVSSRCCRMIERMMAKDPADRYQTPEELIADMELVIDGKEPKSGILSAGRSTIRPRAGASRRESSRLKKYIESEARKKSIPFWLIGTAVAAAILTVAVITSLLSKDTPPQKEINGTETINSTGDEDLTADARGGNQKNTGTQEPDRGRFLSYLAGAGCVLYLSFDRDTIVRKANKRIARDLSGHNNHGVIHGATRANGAVNEALDFDGKDDYVTCGNPKELNFGKGNFTVAVLFKRRSNTVHNLRLLSKGGNAEDPRNAGFCFMGSNNKMSFFVNPTGKRKAVSTGNILRPGEWHAVVGILERNKSQRIYLNGREVHRNPCPSGSVSGPKPFHVGNAIKKKCCLYWDGLIDEVMIFNRALTDREVNVLSNRWKK